MTSKEKAKLIAGTILNQLGGGRFITMTGAKNLSFDEKGALSFRLPKFEGLKINYVKVSLNGKDLYDVEFGRVHGLKYSIIKTSYDTYADMLQDVFTQTTGLNTSL